MDDEELRAAQERFANSELGKLFLGILMGHPISPDAQAIVMDAQIPETGDQPPITEDHFYDVCRAGQGPRCCRYLARTDSGIACGKVIPSLKAEIDRRAPGMKSKGDNCPGRPGRLRSDLPNGRGG
jgi:hypothetical protein